MGNINRLACPETKRDKIKATRLATKQRRESQVGKVVECKIVENKLSKRQREALEMLFIEGKWFYNHILSLRNETHKTLHDFNTTVIKEVKHLDKDGNEIISCLKFLNSQQKQAIVQRIISNELTIFKLIGQGYQKHGELKFKKELTCIPLKQYGMSHKIKTKTKVRIAGIKGNVKVRGLDQSDGVEEYANANLIKKPDGFYFMLTVYKDKSKISISESNHKEIGLDFGIKTNITTSEGEKFDLSVRESERLKGLQRKFQRQLDKQKIESRKIRSKRGWKTLNKIRKEYQKITYQKQDKCNQLIHKFKGYDCVVFQDEQISNWHKGLFGRQVQHSCMGMLKSKLKKMNNIVILNKFIPTTKFCPECGRINKLTLNDRMYVCECGRSLDRDVHSAQNMIEIKNLVFDKLNLKVPTEHREISLAEFKMAAVGLDSSNPTSHGTLMREAATLQCCR